MSILSQKPFHDEAAAFAHVEAMLWVDGRVCPHCGTVNNSYPLKNQRSKASKKNPSGIERHGLYKCGDCRKQFTVRIGTIFEESHLPLHLWLQAIHLMASSKKGISAHQLHRILEVTYKTAWFLAHRIREAMRDGTLTPMGGEGMFVEADTTFIGDRVASAFTETMRSLLEGNADAWLEPDFIRPVRRVFERNLNGVGKTDISLEGEPPISIVPQTAKIAVLALDKLNIEKEANQRDWSRTEYGTIEGVVQSLTRWNDKPAIIVTERLSGEKFTGVLGDELAERIGVQHTWKEAWEGRRVFVSGALHFNAESVIKRADIDDLVSVAWTDVALSDLHKIDILEGRTVAEYLSAIRGADHG